MIHSNPYDAPITLEKLLSIERRAYPPQMWEMQWAEDWEDIADYAQVPLKKLVVLSDGASWYAIIGLRSIRRAEFVDLAKVPETPMLDWAAFVAKLRALGVKTIFGDMRDNTSYRRFRSQLEDLGKLGVCMTKDKPYKRDGEVFHDFVIKI